ncbi:hypothetical protein LPB72_16600 [Hydrogenophaga crassostreae]|uniref:Glycosyl transferase family 1 domain-containing protein n=2 Tax=Hydrogenophaga crassostreae TaxID=1763535 RepID=A0A162P2Q0_9BURK|nr:hypothetical protein LPB072_07115 [Hydrogenophaga crassostreae]OAD40520.1 hypothetical protein LPB72_16600 [Hydrogenophaga crassostreae]
MEGVRHELSEYFSDHPLDYWETEVLRFAENLDNIDIVHAHDLTALRIAVLIGEKRNIPVVYDAHELYSYQPGIFGQRKRELFETEHTLIKYCNEVVVINSDQAGVMQMDHGHGSYTPLTNATVRPIGFDVTKRYAYAREKLNLPDDAKLVLFMGGINRGRKIHLLMEGAARAKTPVHLVFLSWGMEVQEFKLLAIELGIADRTHFVDPVPWSEVVFWAASVDAGFMPYQALDLNTRISSPNKMYEFIAAGTPMIGSSELVNVKKIVETEGFGVLIPLKDAKDYASAIDIMFDEKLGGSERFRQALIERSDQYLFESESREFAKMYDRLLNIDETLECTDEPV